MLQSAVPVQGRAVTEEAAETTAAVTTNALATMKGFMSILAGSWATRGGTRRPVRCLRPARQRAVVVDAIRPRLRRTNDLSRFARDPEPVAWTGLIGDALCARAMRVVHAGAGEVAPL